MDDINKTIAIIAFIGAFALTIKAIYHMYHIITNITGKYSSFFGAFLLLMPGQFNETGNKHRIAFGPTILGVMACWLALYLSGALDK